MCADTSPAGKDVLGFEPSRHISGDVIANLARRRMRWHRKYPRIEDAQHKSFTRPFKRFISKGVPHHLRPNVWRLSASRFAQKYNRKHEDVPILNGSALLQQARSNPHALTIDEDTLMQIKMDMPRTFPEHAEFKEGAHIYEELGHVLRVFAHLHPHIGYCQAMNFLAGVLLLTTRDAEATLSLLQCIVLVYMPDRYTSEMKVQDDVKILQRALNTPRYAHVRSALEDAGVDVTFFAVKWLLMLFVDALPSDQLLVLWDLFFLWGRRVLLQAALFLLHEHVEDLRARPDVNHVMDVLKDLGRTRALTPQAFAHGITQHGGGVVPKLV
ncbi:hypothetical protein PTSG_09852 [Salpingoeca rosetta]|uniref:Rab-GAP TBC domain-containing protein n=1 Tax=Salpingoeca rosetta (strain ATCC 50818 / BSB-021) TaxID=946362 RepID=F2UNC0_SALR5|nr:uncharacterized protein PTSG_09852 [Salpingoeca rosetta]EGD79125.1 hypothetical protein PTSG_09852 [Salpingoeca rosetta]|eukprot:XP_004989210.1 hypothetical protein PTSG_09852 [Salpingoeca rosetta]